MSKPNSHQDQRKSAASLLGPDSKYVRTVPDQAYAYNKKQTPRNPQNINLDTTNDDNFLLVFTADSAPPEKTFVHLDIDDKEPTPQSQAQIEALLKSMPNTYTVKTPSGNGYHLIYTVPDSYAKEIFKYNLGLLANSANVQIEVKFATETGKKTVIPMPGNYNSDKDGYYALTNDTEPTPAPNIVIKHLNHVVQREKESISEILHLRASSFGQQPDSEVNILEAYKYLNEQKWSLMRGEPIQKGFRNDKLYQFFVEVYTRNISLNEGIDLINKNINNTDVFYEILGQDEIDQTANSAYSSVQETNRTLERSVDEITAPWPLDDYLHPTINRQYYIDRIKHTSKLRLDFVLQEPEIRRQILETYVFFGSKIHVPDILEYDAYKIKLKTEMDKSHPLWSELTTLEKNKNLHFKSYSQVDFDRQFRFAPHGKNYKALSLTPEFKYVNRPKTWEFTSEPDNLYENSKFYFAESPPLLIDDITQQETEELNYILNVFANVFTNTDYPEEFEFLLDRMAIPLQKFGVMIDNIPIIYDLFGGSGKSYFFKLYGSMFGRSEVKTVGKIGQLLERFKNPAYVNFVEEFHEKELMANGQWETLKNMSSAEVLEYEVKFEQSEQITASPHFFFATNEHVVETAENRRITVFSSKLMHPAIEFEKHKRRITKFFKGTNTDPIRGIKVFYTTLMNRNVTRTDWDFKTNFQSTVRFNSLISNKRVKSVINYIANLGFTHSEYRFPITHDEILTSDEIGSNEELIINNFDTYAMMVRYYPDMDQESISNIHRNEKLILWCKEDRLTASYYGTTTIDYEKRKKSFFGFGSTYTRAHTPPQELIRGFTPNQLQMFGLESHAEFLKSKNITKESALKFLNKEYPDETPGHINHISKLESDDEF